MLDRNVVEEFIVEELNDLELKIPRNVSKTKLVEAFCQYVENDYYEWLKDNFNSFFEGAETDWNWIRDRIKEYEICE